MGLASGDRCVCVGRAVVPLASMCVVVWWGVPLALTRQLGLINWHERRTFSTPVWTVPPQAPECFLHCPRF